MATVRLSPEQEAKLRYLAALRGMTLADLYRDAIEEYLAREMPKSQEEADSSLWDDLTGMNDSAYESSSDAAQGETAGA